MRVMVCGSIGYGGLSEIRKIQSLLRKEGFTVLDHISKEDMDYSDINDFRDRKGLADRIIKHDLDFIRKSDVVVALLNRPSYGTAVEMFIAKESGKTVFSFSKKEIPTPWPIALSDRVVTSEKELVSALRKLMEHK